MICSTMRSARSGGPSTRSLFRLAFAAAATMALGGCLSTMPTIGGGNDSATTGSAAGETATGSSDNLERCNAPLGTLRIQEDTRSAWYGYYYRRVGSTAPLLNLLIMQSNCFVVVERGSGEADIAAETARARGDEARESATRGKGQQVVADYLLKPEIVLADQGGSGGSVGGIGRLLPGALGVAAGGLGFKNNEASTVLTLVDIRSTVRLAAAQGYSKNTDFNFRGIGIGSMGAVGGSAFTNTPEGKVIAAAFVDSYNKMVVGLRSYKAQTVKGGLGEGGTLGVQGGSTAASKKVK